jgi:hypothetical protein
MRFGKCETALVAWHCCMLWICAYGSACSGAELCTGAGWPTATGSVVIQERTEPCGYGVWVSGCWLCKVLECAQVNALGAFVHVRVPRLCMQHPTQSHNKQLAL